MTGDFNQRAPSGEVPLLGDVVLGRNLEGTCQHRHVVLPAEFCPPLSIKLVADAFRFLHRCLFSNLRVVAVPGDETVDRIGTRELELLLGLEHLPAVSTRIALHDALLHRSGIHRVCPAPASEIGLAAAGRYSSFHGRLLALSQGVLRAVELLRAEHGELLAVDCTPLALPRRRLLKLQHTTHHVLHCLFVTVKAPRNQHLFVRFFCQFDSRARMIALTGFDAADAGLEKFLAHHLKLCLLLLLHFIFGHAF
mmetsp:Transcript_119629/g.168295  ORF Transcript_119629/g.168295 Transcript_119629/m.168295 type:complete len:252 (+) Transcript_119629:202-957(+)